MFSGVGWGGGVVVEDTTCLMNITNKILSLTGFKICVYTKIFGQQEPTLLDKQEKRGWNLIVIF